MSSLCFISWPGARELRLGHLGEERILCSLTQHTQAELAEARTYVSFESVTMVAPGIYHVKARLVDLIGSSGIENATSAQPKNLASAPRLSPLRFLGGVAGGETTFLQQPSVEVGAGMYLL